MCGGRVCRRVYIWLGGMCGRVPLWVEWVRGCVCNWDTCKGLYGIRMNDGVYESRICVGMFMWVGGMCRRMRVRMGWVIGCVCEWTSKGVYGTGMSERVCMRVGCVWLDGKLCMWLGCVREFLWLECVRWCVYDYSVCVRG